MNSIVLKKTEVTLFILFTAIIFQWIPERNIPYLIPFIIYIALSLINPELFFSCFKIFLFIGLIYVHSLFATGLNGTELFYGNLFIFIITNSAVIIFLLMPSSWFLGEKLLEKIIKLI